MTHPIYRVTGLKIVAPYTLWVQFDDDTVQVIDFRSVLVGEMYGPLQDERLFNQVEVDSEVHTLVWPNGADFDPATLHDWSTHVEEIQRLVRRSESHSSYTIENFIERSGGIDISGNASVYGDIVGRDKVILNFAFQLQQFEQAIQAVGNRQSTNIDTGNPAAVNWFDQMSKAIGKIAQCEVEYTRLTNEMNFRLRVWTNELTTLVEQLKVGIRQKGSERMLSDVIGGDTEGYADQLGVLIPRYRQAWDSYFVSQRRVLREWGPNIPRSQVQSLRQSIVEALKSNEGRKKKQEEAREADIERLKQASLGNSSEIELNALRKIVDRHDGLMDEIDRGYAYISHFLRNLDNMIVDD